MTRLLRIVKTLHETLRKAPGPAVVAQVDTPLGDGRELEYYQLPGIAAGPTPDDQAIAIQAGGYRVIIASHNYRLSVPVAPGEVRIYSTDGTGGAIAGEVRFTVGGDVELNGNSKAFVTHAELDSALQTFITALNLHVHTSSIAGSPSSPPVTPMTLNIAAAATTTVKTGG